VKIEHLSFESAPLMVPINPNGTYKLTATPAATAAGCTPGLHREAAVPALLIIGSADPVDVCVRVHDKSMWVGEMPGVDAARFHDTEIHIRFWLDDLTWRRASAQRRRLCRRGRSLSTGRSLRSARRTIDVTATRLSVSEAAGLATLPVKLGNGDRRDGAWVVIIYALSTVPFCWRWPERWQPGRRHDPANRRLSRRASGRR
jgi:hypothetical protein